MQIANLSVSWTDLKAFLDSRSLLCQWIVINNSYRIFANDGGFGLNCIIPMDGTAATDQAAFEASYKTAGNKSPTQGSSSPFASKTIGTKNLYKRVTGMKFPVVMGSNNLNYVATFPWVKFTGIEIINGEVGDFISLYVLDTATGTYSTVPNAVLNQFGYSVNVIPVSYVHKSEFDADIYQGLQIKMVYTSVSVKTIGVNYIISEVK